MREQARRGRDRVDLVLGSRELLPEDQGGDGRAQDDPSEGSVKVMQVLLKYFIKAIRDMFNYRVKQGS